MTVTTRSRAVLWGVAHGLHPDLGPRESFTPPAEVAGPSVSTRWDRRTVGQ